jgi:DNA repair exonuclease SbcCD ATPase subunit
LSDSKIRSQKSRLLPKRNSRSTINTRKKGIEMSGTSNSNGNGKFNQWHIVLMAMGIILSIMISALNGFWSLANPREDIKAIEQRWSTALYNTEQRLGSEIVEIKNFKWTMAPGIDLDRLREDFKDAKNDQKSLLTRDEHKEYVLRKDKDTDYLASQIKDIRGDLISRPEHLQHWKEVDDRISAIRGQLSDLAKDYASKDVVKQSTSELNERMTALSNRLTKNEEQMFGTYNPGKQLENLQTQLNDMRRQMQDLAAVLGQKTTTPLSLMQVPPTPSR